MLTFSIIGMNCLAAEDQASITQGEILSEFKGFRFKSKADPKTNGRILYIFHAPENIDKVAYQDFQGIQVELSDQGEILKIIPMMLKSRLPSQSEINQDVLNGDDLSKIISKYGIDLNNKIQTHFLLVKWAASNLALRRKAHESLGGKLVEKLKANYKEVFNSNFGHAGLAVEGFARGIILYDILSVESSPEDGQAK